MTGEGCSCYDLARWFGENPRTIERWVHYYEEFGVEGLRDRDQCKQGRPTKLSDEQMTALGVAVNKHPKASDYVKSHWDGHLLATILQISMESS